MKLYLPLLGLVLSLFVVGACAPEIGDSCNNASDCSASGTRYCDISQPGGYCTVLGCEADTCPDGSVCVEWQFEPSRTAETWCMETCARSKEAQSGGCRASYSCVSPAWVQLDGKFKWGEDAESPNGPIARIIDLQGSRREAMICAAVAPVEASESTSNTANTANESTSSSPSVNSLSY